LHSEGETSATAHGRAIFSRFEREVAEELRVELSEISHEPFLSTAYA
jgi:hypothetical protein